ncbi:DUF4111 domain-containing protein [Bacillus sp. Gen3]|nr:DUF4111 domain-containing protein [Bacillus sp. Gen3]
MEGGNPVVEQFLDKVCSLFERHLKSNLIGVYLHGSLAMGCFQPQKSDVDILVIVKEKLSKEKKKGLIQDILQLEDYNLEMSVLVEKDIIDFKHPSPFELHYSQVHRDRYLQDPDYLCGDTVDPDLAAHLVVTYERGICLSGKPVKSVFKKIDRSYYIQSIVFDIDNSVQEIIYNPVYYILNLCRVLYYLSEGVVSSKKEGGEWGEKMVPHEYKELISKALSQYINPKFSGFGVNDILLKEFATYMLQEIKSFELT